jgi:hypothetical protein
MAALGGKADDFEANEKVLAENAGLASARAEIGRALRRLEPPLKGKTRIAAARRAGIDVGLRWRPRSTWLVRFAGRRWNRSERACWRKFLADVPKDGKLGDHL